MACMPFVRPPVVARHVATHARSAAAQSTVEPVSNVTVPVAVGTETVAPRRIALPAATTDGLAVASRRTAALPMCTVWRAGGAAIQLAFPASENTITQVPASRNCTEPASAVHPVDLAPSETVTASPELEVAV